MPGHVHFGLLNAWWIQDRGTDRLGRGRNNMPLEQELRGRILFRHRHMLPFDLTMHLEGSWISDINFLEQYFEQEWEEGKDQETLVYLKQQLDNWSWSLLARRRVLDFIPSTDYLPRFDWFLVGEPLLGNRLTYYMHMNAAYMNLLVADRSFGDITVFPDAPATIGSRFDTLHELDMPLNFGSLRVVPYAVGRYTVWSETVAGDSEDRLYGALGSRFCLPLWRVYPSVESDLFNLHALAHKVSLELDYYIAQSDLDRTLLPQYDELEEDAEQVFRMRFLYRDYTLPGKPFPLALDPQHYAIRLALMHYPETLDDLHVLRFNVRQRLQTKRGPPGGRRIIDWMKLDLGAAWFPEADRDNLGAEFGLLTYEYAWFIGDRTTLTSSGWFEPADDGPRFWDMGLFLMRPTRGNLYLGYMQMSPIGSRIARATFNYYMSPKWISSLSTAYDFGERRSLGQSIRLTRVGADLIFRLAIKVNPLRRDYGVGIELMPRILSQLGIEAGRYGEDLPSLVQYAPVE